jgi:hypothetical protein
MKKALIIIVLLLVLFSTGVSAIPFNLIVGKQGSAHLDQWGTGSRDMSLPLPKHVYVYEAIMAAERTRYRCGGHWEGSY